MHDANIVKLRALSLFSLNVKVMLIRESFIKNKRLFSGESSLFVSPPDGSGGGALLRILFRESAFSFF